MGIFDKLFKVKKEESDNLGVDLNKKEIEKKAKIEIDIDLPKNELVQITDNNILDPTSPIAIAKLKHNLEILISKAKKDGKIDKFMIIREDDFFPYDWEWRVASKDTCYEKIALALSLELKEQYALETSNVLAYFDGIQLPVSKETKEKALKQVDKETGFINVPVRFRSTKHFTINTPLEITGAYNSVQSYRNFIVIDTIDNFLSSGYAYAVSYRDAYLDVTHESLPISKNAIILMHESKYSKIMSDPIIAKALQSRKVIVYRGEKVEYMAINMILSELGVLPSTVGMMYANYDDEVTQIIESSLQNLAKNHHLLYNKSHSGVLSPNGGHFSNYYDDKNQDYEKSLEELVKFLKKRFPEQANLITKKGINDSHESSKIVHEIGTKQLLKAIEEYNQMYEIKSKERFELYKKNRSCITKDIREFFQKTLQRISYYYNKEEQYAYPFEIQQEVEKTICHFLHDSTIQEQIMAAQNLWKILNQVQEIQIEPPINEQNASLKM